MTIEWLKNLHDEIWTERQINDNRWGIRHVSDAVRTLTADEWETVQELIEKLNLVVSIHRFGFFDGILMMLTSHPEYPGLDKEVLNASEFFVFSMCHEHFPCDGKQFAPAVEAFFEIASTPRNTKHAARYGINNALRIENYEY